MSRPQGTPKLLIRKSPSTGRSVACAYFARRLVSFGPAGPEATAAFERTLAEWISNGRRFAEPEDANLTVADVLADYLVFAETIYTPSCMENVKRALRLVIERFASLPVRAFKVASLQQVQEELADSQICRSTVRARINTIRRAFRWCESRRLVPAGTWEHLRSLEHVRPGRTRATESKLVEAVTWSMVEPVLPFLSTPLRAAVLLQWYSGMRPGEVCSLTGAQLDRTGPVWIYRPKQHKGVWKGRERIVRIGPRAQKVLRPLLKLDPEAAILSPRDAIAEQKAVKAATRKTRVQPSQRLRAQRAAANPKLEVDEFYDANTYRRAVHRACDQAAGVPRWSPHRLRHACATRLFEAGDYEAARAVLGHSRLDMTRHYAKLADSRLATEAMQQHG